jgi:hypothetical protein
MRAPATPIWTDRSPGQGRWLALYSLPFVLAGLTAVGLSSMAATSVVASSAAAHRVATPHAAAPRSAWNGATSARSAWN